MAVLDLDVHTALDYRAYLEGVATRVVALRNRRTEATPTLSGLFGWIKRGASRGARPCAPTVVCDLLSVGLWSVGLWSVDSLIEDQRLSLYNKLHGCRRTGEGRLRAA